MTDPKPAPVDPLVLRVQMMASAELADRLERIRDNRRAFTKEATDRYLTEAAKRLTPGWKPPDPWIPMPRG